MKQNTFFDSVLNVVGIVTLVAIAVHTIRTISKRTDTKVISNEALNALNDKKKALELREVVEDYHSTGEWDQNKLDTIL